VTTPLFFHADLDAFFASVEQLDHPELRGRPVIIGGLPGDRRSVVSTASYEARRFGVHSAMPIAEAARLCPKGVFLRGRMARYLERSAEVMAVFGEYSDQVQQLSVDEAVLDMGGTERLFGPPAEAARKLKAAVKERTGLTVSVGVGSNKYVAKIASGMQKPDGLFIVPPGGEEAFMLGLPLTKLWGAGAKTLEHLRRNGVRTMEDLHRMSLSRLENIFGKAAARFLYRAVRGEAAEDFDAPAKSRSLSCEETFPLDIRDPEHLRRTLLEMSHRVMFRLMKHRLQGRTIHLKLRYGDFSTESIQETLREDLTTGDQLFEHVTALFDKKYRYGEGLRLLGVGVGKVGPAEGAAQGELFDTGIAKKQAVERTVLELNQKYAAGVVKKAKLLHNGAST
jgi:DNA polymerase-4